MAVASLAQRMDPAMGRELEKRRGALAAAGGALGALNPMSVLTRGFCAAFSGAGQLIKSVGQVAAGDEITIQMTDGTADAVVRSVRLSDPIAEES